MFVIKSRIISRRIHAARPE